MEEREALIESVLAIDHRFYSHLQLGGSQEWADIDLTMPQLKVMFLIAGGEGLNMTHLARALGMTLSTLTGVVDRLVHQGLVRRVDDAHDRRVVLLYSTEQGAALLDRFVRAGRARLRLILDRLSLEELRQVAKVLDILYEAAIRPAGCASATHGS